MFLRGCNRRLAADENGLICAEILNHNTKHFGYLGSRTWPYKRGEPPQLGIVESTSEESRRGSGNNAFRNASFNWSAYAFIDEVLKNNSNIIETMYV